MTKWVNTAGRLAVVTGAFALLMSCSGIDAASDAVARAGHRVSFVQLPLIASTASPGRVLEMQVFSGVAGNVPRASETVSFHAQLQP